MHKDQWGKQQLRTSSSDLAHSMALHLVHHLFVCFIYQDVHAYPQRASVGADYHSNQAGVGLDLFNK